MLIVCSYTQLMSHVSSSSKCMPIRIAFPSPCCRSSVRSWVWMLLCSLTLVQECISCVTGPRSRPSGWGSHQTCAAPCVGSSSSSTRRSALNWVHWKWSSSSSPRSRLTGTSRCGLQTQRSWHWRGPRRLWSSRPSNLSASTIPSSSPLRRCGRSSLVGLLLKGGTSDVRQHCWCS